jgi:thiamine-phosphate pyrophosphorylase
LPRVEFDMYLITDREQCRGEDLVARVERALNGGIRAVQLREKGLSTRERFELGQRLRRITLEFGARLLVNGDAALARAIGADGVHLPQDGLPADACRKVVGPDMLIGISTHSVSEAGEAEERGADFVTYGPVYCTPSKAKYGAPIGIDSLRAVCASASLPVFALGGVRLSNIDEVVSAGAAGVAMISAILAAADVESAVSEIAGCLRRAHSAENFSKKEG